MSHKGYSSKWIYWIPFVIIAVSFVIYCFEYFSLNPIVFNGVREKDPGYIYFRYLTYFFILSALLAQALIKTINLSKAQALLISISSVSAPLLTFRHLIIQPFHFLELTSIFYEIAFIVFLTGITHICFYIFNQINKIFFKIPVNEEGITALLIIASMVFLWGFYLDSFTLQGDSLKLFVAGMHPSANTYDYWLHIFTNTHNGPQYRPISFFAIFYFVRSAFGAVAWPFQFLSLILTILGGCLFFNLAKKYIKNYFPALIASCFLASHPAVIKAATHPSLGVKYIFPLVFLIFGMFLIQKRLHIKPLYTITLILLSCVSIMSHEGSFTFPIAFILFDFGLHKKARKQHIFLMIPSVIYGLARLFYFGAPTEGYMQIRLSALITQLPQHLDQALAPKLFLKAITNFPSISLVFFAAIPLLFYFIPKKHYINLGLLFLSIIILVHDNLRGLFLMIFNNNTYKLSCL